MVKSLRNPIEHLGSSFPRKRHRYDTADINSLEQESDVTLNEYARFPRTCTGRNNQRSRFSYCSALLKREGCRLVLQQ
jgi:hypothetical protein